MKYETIEEAMKKGSGKVALRGWVYRERGSAKVKFIVLRDGTNILQCVVKNNNEPLWKEAEKATIESSVELEGAIRKDDRAPTGFEVEVEKLRVVGESQSYPITKDQSTEFLLDQRHLWLRSRYLVAIMKIRNTVLQAFRNYYLEQGFLEFSPPILQPSQCEGGATLFEVKYYKAKTFLTQSWQLYGEAAIHGYPKYFCISPCFRAETSKTSRHLSEFWMAEMEAAWMELDEMLDSIEGCICRIVSDVLKYNKEELKILNRDISKLEKVKSPLPRTTYTEVLKTLKEKDNLDIPWGKDLRTVEEDTIMKHYDKPLMVTRYPKDIMAFYKPKDPKNPEVALCIDVLAPEGYGELVGGSQRDLDIKQMTEELEKDGEKPENYSWYFDLRKYGAVPHSGFGLGVERTVSWICGLENIKDAIPFPRTQLRWKP